MNDWLKVLVPGLLTGIGVLIFTIVNDITEMKQTQISAGTWFYRIEQAEVDIQELKDRRDCTPFGELFLKGHGKER